MRCVTDNRDGRWEIVGSVLLRGGAATEPKAAVRASMLLHMGMRKKRACMCV